MTNSSNNQTSDTTENLLFTSLLYHITNEPENIRNSTLPLDLILSNKALDEKTKVQSIESAFKTIDHIKDRDGAFTAFEAFLEDSRSNLVFVDKDFHHIFHNQKSNKIITELFDNQSPRKLKPKVINLIRNAQIEDTNNKKLLSIPNVLDNNATLYLISNKHKLENDRDFHILLIPNFDDQQFQIQQELVKKYQLTNKETLVLTNLVSGHLVQEISEQFCISLNTVRSHLKSIYRKTDTKSQSDLIRLFLNHESQYLDSYFEPTKLALNLDIKTVSKDLFVTLSKGNKICYRDYGPKKGRPIIICHNLLGSRFNIPYQYSKILENTNRRVIIPERPGYGLSDFVEYNLEEWNTMFNEFINEIGIEKFSLLGNVSGSAIALNYAAVYPNSIKSLLLTSPLFLNDITQTNLLRGLAYSASKTVSYSHAFAKTIYRLWVHSMKFNPESSIRKMIKHTSGYKEIATLENQYYIDRLTLNFNESQRNNSKGSALDAVHTLTPLLLNLTNIKVPCHIWMGDEDSLISVASAKEICEPIPNKTFHVREGYGEDIFYHLFEEIIQ